MCLIQSGDPQKCKLPTWNKKAPIVQSWLPLQAYRQGWKKIPEGEENLSKLHTDRKNKNEANHNRASIYLKSFICPVEPYLTINEYRMRTIRGFCSDIKYCISENILRVKEKVIFFLIIYLYNLLLL